jgi:translation initiation factor 1 (eIF-1/SUI1)
MATKIYESYYVELIDGERLEISPLKIKYMREFMHEFNNARDSKDDDDALGHLSRCVLIAMKQYRPEIKTIAELEDIVDLPTVYKILEIAAGVTISQDSSDPVTEQINDGDLTWEKLDLATLESELFLLGIWRDYDELENSLSMPELLATLDAYRDSDYRHKKFLAAIQGVDLDKESGNTQNAWENLKAKVFSGGKAKDGNDVLALQGANAQKAGFGINMGLGYEDLTKK